MREFVAHVGRFVRYPVVWLSIPALVAAIAVAFSPLDAAAPWVFWGLLGLVLLGLVAVR